MLVPTATVGNFEFAFNDSDLSDRVLHIEIMEDSLDHGGRDRVPNRKRTREDLEKENEDDAARSHGSDCSTVVEVKTFHISSPIVAAKSPFFYTLFKNGMKESQQRDVTLRVNTCEEAALVDLLKFMYNNTLGATTVPDLLDVLVVADKFQVISCMRHCIELLQKTPMSLESALLYLELPSSVVDSEVVQPLIHETKLYLAARYRDISKSREEVMALPLAAIEVVLGSDGLQVVSEDDVFDFVLKWAHEHYPELEERRDALSKRLSQLVCFRNMSSRKLKQVRDCPDFDHEQVCKLVFDALFFKAEGRTVRSSRNLSAANSGFVERAYATRPIKVVQLGLSRPRCVVYFELKKEECADLYQSRTIFSDVFHLGGQWFSLSPRCIMDQQSLLYHFGMSVVVYKGSRSFTCDYEFEVMKKPLEVFESKHKYKAQKCIPKKTIVLGFKNLFGIQWEDFMADESEYFIDGILHLRANMTINNSQT